MENPVNPPELMNDRELAEILHLSTNEIVRLPEATYRPFMQSLAVSNMAGAQELHNRLNERAMLLHQGRQIENNIRETRRERVRAFGPVGNFLSRLLNPIEDHPPALPPILHACETRETSRDSLFDVAEYDDQDKNAFPAPESALRKAISESEGKNLNVYAAVDDSFSDVLFFGKDLSYIESVPKSFVSANIFSNAALASAKSPNALIDISITLDEHGQGISAPNYPMQENAADVQCSTVEQVRTSPEFIQLQTNKQHQDPIRIQEPSTMPKESVAHRTRTKRKIEEPEEYEPIAKRTRSQTGGNR